MRQVEIRAKVCHKTLLFSLQILQVYKEMSHQLNHSEHAKFVCKNLTYDSSAISSHDDIVSPQEQIDTVSHIQWLEEGIKLFYNNLNKLFLTLMFQKPVPMPMCLN